MFDVTRAATIEAFALHIGTKNTNASLALLFSKRIAEPIQLFFYLLVIRLKVSFVNLVNFAL